MGLTKQSVGMGAVDSGLEIKKQTPDDKIIAIAGNPNVGKSTLFNNLTGMNQHTGNWPGKTVTNAQGYCKTREHSYVLVDIPGTYSLMAHSTEEEVARNFICFGGSDGVVVVCDATCLERNLNLVLQTMEISDRVLVCVNLMDEAARKNITIDLKGLSEKLGVPVAGTIARKKQSLDQLMKQLDGLVEGTQTASPYQVEYSPIIEQAIAMAEPAVKGRVEGKVNSRWLTLKLLDSDPSLMKELREYLDEDILEVPEISLALSQAREHLAKYGITPGSVELWGTGTPLREFLWSEDMADACVHVMEQVDFSQLQEGGREVRNCHINIGTGKEISIGGLARLIAATAGYRGNLAFNADKPDGTMRKLTDVSKLHSLGWKHRVELEEGVERIYRWYLSRMEADGN